MTRVAVAVATLSLAFSVFAVGRPASASPPEASLTPGASAPAATQLAETLPPEESPAPDPTAPVESERADSHLKELAAPDASAPLETQLTGRRPTAGDRRHPKLDSQLAAVIQSDSDRGPETALAEARGRGLDVVDNRIRVVIESVPGSGAGARAAASAAGGEVEAEYANLIQAVLPIQALERVAGDADVRYVRPPFHAEPLAVTSEGVAGTNAPDWHAAGTTGAGVKIGVIDLGFAGYTDAIASGDLPAGVTAHDEWCGGGFLATASEHGTAVAEIVHDMAPGAQLYLICFDTEVGLGLAKDYAKTNGIQIINHSVGWLNSSRGDGSGGAGTPDGIVADARANGILWVNSAGNSAQQHWSGTFSDNDGNDSHDFASGDNRNNFWLPSLQTVCIALKWDAWPTTTQDFDLGLWNSAPDLVAASVNEQSPAGLRPTEEFCYTNPGVSQSFGIEIFRWAATTAPRFDLFVVGGGSGLEYQVSAGSLLEPATSPNAMSVGAVCWQDNALEPFSSRGPNIAGRVKPDIAGPDSVSSGTYGAFGGSCGASGFPGTSASAPHVAGAAALVEQSHAMSGPAEVQRFLECRATDLGAPGSDNQYGAGRLTLGTPRDATPDFDGPIYLLDQPARLVDTRPGSGYDGAGAPLQGLSTPRCFVLGGRAGIPVDAVGVLANVTIVSPGTAQHLTIWPDPEAQPATSNLNYMPWQAALANMAIIRVGTGGAVSVNGAAGANVIIDVVGYIAPDGGTTPAPGVTLAGQQHLLTKPERVVDTRANSGYQGAGDPLDGTTAAGACYTVAGTGGAPGVPGDAVGVLANVTTVGHPVAAHLTIWPHGEAMPPTSNVNYHPIQSAQANMAIIRVGDEGKVCVVAASGVNVIVDIVGYLAGVHAPTTESGTPQLLDGPIRLVDTRPGSGYDGAGNPLDGLNATPTCYTVAGLPGSGVPTTAAGILANVTTVGHAVAAHLTIWPQGEAMPATSNLNYVPQESALANMAIIRVGTDQQVCAVAAAGVNVIIDVVGYIK